MGFLEFGLFVATYCLYVVFFKLRWILDLFSTRNPIFYFKTRKNTIALTIDDSPDPQTTPIILDALKRHGIKATFFVIGSKAKLYPEILERMVKEGHQLGNHDYYDRLSVAQVHHGWGIWMDPEQFESDLLETQSIIDNVQQKDVKRWFRPGRGRFNKELIRCIEKLGFKMVLGDCYPFDCALPFSWLMTWIIVWYLNPGSIIIIHDGTASRAKNTAETIDNIAPMLIKNGYSFHTLDEMEVIENE